MGSPRHRRSRGASLIELMVAIAITSIIVVGAFLVMTEGLQLFRTNLRAAEAQADVLQVLSRVTTEAVNAKSNLVRAYPTPPSGSELPGIVFASPLQDSGNVRIDDITAEIYWQKWICYYYVAGAGGERGKIYRAEAVIPPDNAGGPGSTDILGVVEPGLDARTTDYFETTPGLNKRTLGTDISGFKVVPYAGTVGGAGSGVIVHDAYDITVEAGSYLNRSSTGYYIRVDSRVTPRG